MLPPHLDSARSVGLGPQLVTVLFLVVGLLPSLSVDCGMFSHGEWVMGWCSLGQGIPLLAVLSGASTHSGLDRGTGSLLVPVLGVAWGEAPQDWVGKA